MGIVIVPVASVDSSLTCLDTVRFDPDKSTFDTLLELIGAYKPPFSLTLGFPSQKQTISVPEGNAPLQTFSTVVTATTVIELPSAETAETLLNVSEVIPDI